MAYSNIGVFYNTVSTMKMAQAGTWTIGEIEALTPMERSMHIELMTTYLKELARRDKIVK